MNVAVNFPMPFPSRCSPDRDAARRRNLDWARASGLVTNEIDERRYGSWDIADLAARWLPRASGARLDLAVDAIVVGTLIDEQFDGARDIPPEQVRADCETLLAVLQVEGPPSSPVGVLATALADVWARTCRGASLEWRRRAARHWRWFLEAFPEEARWRQGSVRLTRDRFLALRRKSGLVYMMMDLTEKANGFETTERARQVPGVQQLLDLTADLIDTMNDVCSFEKERARGDVHNLVLVLQSERGGPCEKALAETHDTMRRWCQEFIQLAAGLPEACARQQLSRVETDNLLRLVQGLEENIGGHPDWYRTTRRYEGVIPRGEAAYASDLMRPVARVSR
ncbi:terpene synthase family protein [Myxococcus faecalis]|uniref:terpene synthase family protein n=1 Tax=Myxococcus faecalis TaxID=3115646 RepID=UPI0038D1FD41